MKQLNIRITLVFVYFLLYANAQDQFLSQYDLPTLDVKSDQLYLHKKLPTNLTCTVGAGWSNIHVNKVTWYKDEVILPPDNPDYQQAQTNLSILGIKQQNEGLYQCKVELSNVKLSNGKIISTTLMSAPLRMRRARLTKFDTMNIHGGVTVSEMEVARLPCTGMPDIVPGPPKICFQRMGSNECLGDGGKNDTKYLMTNSGMQISLVQPSDSGFYHCVVTNLYLNLTRVSPNPVLLYVREMNHTAKTDASSLTPTLIYPVSNSSLDSPIVVDVTEGDEVILECVMSMAKVIWHKYKNESTSQSDFDIYKNSRYQQIWGNLRIKTVATVDSGLYSCIGLPMVGTDIVFDENTKPRVNYKVIVHVKTYGYPVISTNILSCRGENMAYEIPMLYLNGIPVSQSADLLGEVISTSFYSNPIEVKYKPTEFGLSFQCASRPAMEEAEVYGEGLETGRSKNYYVFSVNPKKSIGDDKITIDVGKDAVLPCAIEPYFRGSTWWTKDGRDVSIVHGRFSLGEAHSLLIPNVTLNDEGWYSCNVGTTNQKPFYKRTYLKVTEPFVVRKKNDDLELEDVHGFVTGNSVRLQWAVLAAVTSLAKIANFSIEAQRFGTSENDWFVIETVNSHVRATTVQGFEPNHKYKMRIIVVREDGSTVISKETSYMFVGFPNGDVVPTKPEIDGIFMNSQNTAVVMFSQNDANRNATGRTFFVIYKKVGEELQQMTQVEGTQREALINIKLDTDYLIHLVAENAAGKTSSQEHLFKTTRTGMLLQARVFWDSIQRYLTFKNIALFGILFTLSSMMLLICFVVFCNLRSGKGRQKSQANGKFLDTSYRIFNEQKVHKSRILDDTIDNLDGDENSPLKIKSEENDSDKYGGFHVQESDMPNLYGNIDDMMDIECNQDTFPHDPTYVSSSIRQSSGLGCGSQAEIHKTARCYSPESRTSHEMLVSSYSRSAAHSTANSSSPQLNHPGGSIQRVKAYNYPDSLLYSPAGTTCSIAETTSSGIGMTQNRLNCDSPTNPSDEGDNRYGGSSRNSHISSSDGSKVMSMGTFKGGSTYNNTFADTFDRRRSENVA